MTAFDQLFLMGRHPRGGIESLDQMRAAGFAGIFCNIGDHAPSEWNLIRERAAAQGMFCGPWLHTRGADGRFSIPRLEALIECAWAWGSPVIVNSEKELDGTGSAFTELIAEETAGLDAAVSMEAWLFNPPSVDWTPVAHLPMLLQIFPAESAAATDPAGCKHHAHECGIRCVYFTFGSYGAQTPADYDLTAPYSIYTADDCGGAYDEWTPHRTGFVGCQEKGDDVELIGSQHGFDAMLSWMQKQPTIPQRGPGYRANDITTWPWPDKVHRALTILAADHDQEASA